MKLLIAGLTGDSAHRYETPLPNRSDVSLIDHEGAAHQHQRLFGGKQEC